MKKQFAYILCALLCALSFLSCSKDGPDAAPNRRVVIMYAASFSNLSPSIEENINQFCKSEKLPSVGSSDIFLVYAHTTERFGVYVNTSPVLFRAYTGTDGKPKRDTLNVYPNTDILTEVQGLFPAKATDSSSPPTAKDGFPKAIRKKFIPFSTNKSSGGNIRSQRTSAMRSPRSPAWTSQNSKTPYRCIWISAFWTPASWVA